MICLGRSIDISISRIRIRFDIHNMKQIRLNVDTQQESCQYYDGCANNKENTEGCFGKEYAS